MNWFTPEMNDGSNVFVFGSNSAGRHGAGAASYAENHWGAIYGCGEGRQGQAYGIPTKDHVLATRSLEHIKVSVDTFLDYARRHPRLKFLITEIGCGLAGYSPKYIAPLFVNAPANCVFTDSFKAVLTRCEQEDKSQ